MDTIYKIKSDEENEVIFVFESVIEDGEFKVVVITPDNEVIDIINGTEEGNEIIIVKDGVSRVKLVGRKAKGEIRIVIESEDDVEIKRADQLKYTLLCGKSISLYYEKSSYIKE